MYLLCMVCSSSMHVVVVSAGHCRSQARHEWARILVSGRTTDLEEKQNFASFDLFSCRILEQEQ